MGTRLLTTIVMIAVVAVVFSSIGMAYTASTENTGNNLTSKYVVLEQTNYSFGGNSSFKFDIITTVDGTVYQADGVEVLAIPGGITYRGVQIGANDTLKATEVGTSEGSIDVLVKTFGDGFTDFSHYANGWRYILKVVGPDPEGIEDPLVQYAVYDGGTDGNSDLAEWTYYCVDSGVVSEADSLTIKTYADVSDVYTTSLYFVGPESGSMASSPVRPDADSENGVIISNGTIQFIYDSDGGTQNEQL